MYVLRVKVNGEQLRQMYEEAPDTHESDSGFDLLTPSDFTYNAGQTGLMDMCVQCAAYRASASPTSAWEPAGQVAPSSAWEPTGFLLYPRSSICRTPLRMANSVGVIDSGYRGFLCAAFDNTGGEYEVEAGTRLVQICMPDLSPFRVEFVEELDDTPRGGGGFGSTGV